MALILTSRTPWRQRPSGIVVPHVGSQAYAGLVGWWYWDGALARDGLTSAGFAPTGTSSSDVDPHVGPYLNTAADAYVATTLLGPSGTPGLSVSAWVLVPSIANNATIIGARGNGWKFGVNGASAGDPLRLTFFGVADQDSSASGIAANTWTHVAVTYNKVSVRFFLNGQLVSSHARTTAIGDTSIYPFFLSAYNNNGTPADNAGCRFVDVRYYQRGRSDGEVWADYDPATRWSLYAPVVRLLYVDLGGGGGGTTYNESIAVAADASLTHAHTLTVSEALAMAVDATMSPVGPLTAAAALGLDADATVAKVSALTAGSGIALGADAAVSPVAALSASPAMSLDADVSLAKSTAVAAVEAIALAADATLSKATTLVAAISLALAADASLSATDGTNSTYDEALALSADASLTPTGALIASLVADYAADAGLSAATSATIGEAIGLDLAGALEHVTQAAVAESIALGLTAVLQLAATASGDVTYTILRVAAETLRSARAQNDALRSAHVTGETLQ